MYMGMAQALLWRFQRNGWVYNASEELVRDTVVNIEIIKRS